MSDSSLLSKTVAGTMAACAAVLCFNTTAAAKERPLFEFGVHNHTTGETTSYKYYPNGAPPPSQDDRYRQPADTARFTNGALEGYVTQMESRDGGPDAHQIEARVVDPTRHILVGNKKHPLTYTVTFNPAIKEGHIETTGLFRNNYVAYSSDFAINGRSVQLIDPTAYYLEGIGPDGYPRQGQEYAALTAVLGAQANATNLSSTSQVAGLIQDVVIGVDFAKQYLQSKKYVPAQPHQEGYDVGSHGYKHSTIVQNIENGENERGEYHKYIITTSIDVQAGAPPLTNDLTIKIYPEATQAPYSLDALVEQACNQKIRLNAATLGGQNPLVFEKLSRYQLLLSLTKLQKETSVDAPFPTKAGGFSYGNAKQVEASRELREFAGAKTYEDLEKQITEKLIDAFNDLPREVKQAIGYRGDSRMTTRPAQSTSGTKNTPPARQATRPATGSNAGGESQMDLLEKAANGEIRVQFGPPAGYQAPQPK